MSIFTDSYHGSYIKVDENFPNQHDFKYIFCASKDIYISLDIHKIEQILLSSITYQYNFRFLIPCHFVIPCPFAINLCYVPKVNHI